MRYFLLTFLMAIVLVVGWAGFRGDMSRNPPIEVFPDMDRQPKVRPQEPSRFFADGLGSRLPVTNTVARSQPLTVAAAQGARQVFPFEDSPVNTGQIPGTTNFVTASPIRVDAALMERGHDRYQIFCLPCHGATGDGNGITKKLGMATVANLHDSRLVRVTDGELFYVITHGRNSMGAYAAQLEVQDRWAVVAYVRALQFSRLGEMNDVPEAMRATMKK